MSQYAAELCTLLVEDNFGDLFGRVYSTLVQYGRLTLPRLRDHARITNRQLFHALAAMIQMHLVYHSTSIEDGMTYYEASVNAAYYLIRSGKMLQTVEERLGKYTTKVMSAIMYCGHAQVSYLENLAELQPGENGVFPTNGNSHDHREENGEQNEQEEAPLSSLDHDSYANGDENTHNPRLHTALRSLAGHGYICRVKDTHFQSLADNTLEAERAAVVSVSSSSLKGKGLAAELEVRIEKALRERLDGDLSHGLLVQGIPFGVKRSRANGLPENPSKRRRLASPGADSGSDTEDEDGDYLMNEHDSMDSSIVIRANYEKLDVVFRNHRLVELALQGTSPVTAQVYETLLRLIEYQTPRCRSGVEIPREGEEGETNSAAITVPRLVNELDTRLDLTGSLGPSGKPQSGAKKNKRPLENGMNGNYHDDDDEDNTENGITETTRAYDVDQHLGLLAQPPYSLSTRRSNGTIPTWTVEFRRLARQLRHLEIERIVGNRFGRIALRLLRILSEKGKLDEKRLQELSLISQKDLRQTLAHLQENGFVDLQEIPRDSQRLPSKTVFLWFFDPDRVCRNLLHDTYKAMSRCLQRLRFERNRLKDFLDKTERTDVKGNEDKYLTEGELQTLQQWRDKEAMILGEVARLDDLVAVLRDY